MGTALLRRELGDVLREHRRAQGRTLRDVSARAAVSLGYLSEIERGEKEASSELLASICSALEVPLSRLLAVVSRKVAETEALTGPVPLAPTVVRAVPAAPSSEVSASAA